MKVSGMLIALLGLFPLLAAGEFRTFTDREGRSIEAELIDYDSDRMTAEIKMRNGKSYDVPLTKFSGEDQRFIQDWAKNRKWLLTEDSDLEIEVKIGRKTNEVNAYLNEHENTLQPSIVIENRELYESYEGATATLLLIGENLGTKGIWEVLYRQEFEFSVAKLSKTSMEGKVVATNYYDRNEYGYGVRYDGYIFYLTNSEGHRVHVRASKGVWEENLQKAIQLRERQEVDRKLNRVTR